MKHYPHHISDFNNATRHLTRVERSLYRDLIELYYETERPLPIEVAEVSRRIVANELSTDVERMLNEFFVQTPDGWYHVRCDEEITKYQGNNSQRAQAGKASAAKKALKKQQALNGKSTSVEIPLNDTPTEIHNQSTNQPINLLNKKNTALTRPTDDSPVRTAARRRQQIPDAFYPDETGLDKAREKGLSVAVQLTKFVDYHVGKGSVMSDWQAAWRTWIGNARPDGPNAARPKYAAAAAAIFDDEPTTHPETIDV